MNLIFEAIDRLMDASEQAQKARTRRSEQADARDYNCQQSCPAEEACRLKQCECAQIDEADRLVAAQERVKDQQ